MILIDFGDCKMGIKIIGLGEVGRKGGKELYEVWFNCSAIIGCGNWLVLGEYNELRCSSGIVLVLWLKLFTLLYGLKRSLNSFSLPIELSAFISHGFALRSMLLSLFLWWSRGVKCFFSDFLKPFLKKDCSFVIRLAGLLVGELPKL